MSGRGRPIQGSSIAVSLPEHDWIFIELALLEVMNTYEKEGNDWRALQCERLSAMISNRVNEARKEARLPGAAEDPAGAADIFCRSNK